MIKGLLRISLLSTVIFFTAQLGWSATTITTSEDPNNYLGKNFGDSTEGSTTAIGANDKCPSGTCNRNTIQVPLGAHTTAPLSSGAGTNSNTSGGSN